MNELLIFFGVMAFAAVLDMRRMRKEKLRREQIVYFGICACALVLAVLYFTELNRSSIIGYVLRLFGKKV